MNISKILLGNPKAPRSGEGEELSVIADLHAMNWILPCYLQLVQR